MTKYVKQNTKKGGSMKSITMFVLMALVSINVLGQELLVTYPRTACVWSCDAADIDIAGTAYEDPVNKMIYFRAGKRVGTCLVSTNTFEHPGTAYVLDENGTPLSYAQGYGREDVYAEIAVPYEDLNIPIGESRRFRLTTITTSSGYTALTGWIVVENVGPIGLAVPSIVTPNNNASVKIGTWFEFEGSATGLYYLQIAEVQNSSPEWDEECGFNTASIVDEFPINEGEFIWNNAQPGSTYQATVAARTDDGGQSLFSDIIEFSVDEDASTDPPTTTEPAANHIFPSKKELDSFTYKWDMGDCDVSHYKIIVQRQDGKSDWKTILEKGWFSENQLTVEVHDYENGGIKGVGSYRWRVVGRNALGVVQCRSDFSYFCVRVCGDYPTASLVGDFMEAGERYHVPYNLGLAIAKVETDYNLNPVNFGPLTTPYITGPKGFGIMNLYAGAMQGANGNSSNGLEILAQMLKKGTRAGEGFDGWDEYANMPDADIVNLIINNNVDDQDAARRANIRAGMLLLRYYAHFIQPDEMGYDPKKDEENNANYPQLGLETWWFIVNRWNIRNDKPEVDNIEQLMESNYAFRVYNKIMEGVPGYINAIPITLPPHINFRLAEEHELDVYGEQRGIAKQSDWSLIPTAPNEPDYTFVRITVPFIPRTHLGVIHDDEGENIGIQLDDPAYENEKFVLKFPIEGYSAYDAPMTTVFDFCGSISGDQANDGVTISFTGAYGIQESGSCCRSVPDCYPISAGSVKRLAPGYYSTSCLSYDGHTSEDRPFDKGTNQYAPATGKVKIYDDHPENIARNVFGIFHNNAGEGYESVFSHSETINIDDSEKITSENISKLIATVGGKAPIAVNPHQHMGIRYVQDIGSLRMFDVTEIRNGVYISALGWRANDDVEYFSQKGNKDAKILWTRARYNILWSDQKRILESDSEKGKFIKKAYPNPATEELTVETKKEMKSIVFTSLEGTDISGAITVSGKKVTLSISNLPKGFYLVTVFFTDNTFESTKVQIGN